MSIAFAKQEHAKRGSTPESTRNKPGDHLAPGTKGTLEGMSPDERRKTTADWLITWLKEGDGHRSTCSA